MRPLPIPTSALRTVPYIPENQDAERYKAEAIADLRKRQQAHDRRWENPVEAGSDLEKERDAGRTNLHNEFAEIEDRYQAMRAKYPEPQTFILAIPTSVERDMLNSRLVSLGLKQATPEVLKATLIEELFHQRWHEPEPGEEFDPNKNETLAEAHANLLDSVWMRSEAHDAAIAQWQEVERERIVDEMEGAPAREPTPLPTKIISARDNARAQLLIDRMMSESQRLRDIAAHNMDFARQNSMMLVRLHVVDAPWAGFPVERDPKNGALSDATIKALRELVDDVSWHALVGHIDRMYLLDGGEEKNSVSPLGSSTPPTGSPAPSVDPETSGGSSTVSNIVPLPGVGLGTTIDKSFDSGIVSAAPPPPPASSPSPTDAA
jgi:hypothetical protein